jgi:uncharacterized protein YchJ
MKPEMAEPQRNRVLAGERISRAALATVEDVSDAAIAAAVGALDHERAALLALARARRGEPVPVAVVASILPGIELPAITCALLAIASGDKAELIDVLEQRRFPQTKDSAELEAIVLYAAWRAGAAPARVTPEVRRLSVRSMTAEGFALLANVAAAIDNENVAAATKHIASYAKDYAKQAAADERAMTAKLDDVIAALPAEVEISVGGFTVRAAKQAGRNDPCPCGSGLKFKKCCADKPVAAPSPIPGLSWDEFLAGDRMTVQHVEELDLRDLARADLARMPAKPLAAAFRRFKLAHAWDHAERAVEHANDPDLREELVLELLAAGDLPRAKPHIAKLPDDYQRAYRLDLAADPATAWTALLEECEAALRSGDKIVDVDLAYALLRAAPALGVYMARACIGTLHFDDPDLLLEHVEDVRDRLDLPPTDPAWTVLDDLTDREHEAKPDDDKLRSSLQESSARVDQLERSLSAMRAELDAARTKSPAALARTPEAEKPSGLEQRVHELEALIREGNAERRELRDKLRAADVAKDEGHRARRAEAPAETDDAETEAIEPGARNIAIPRFDRRVIDAFAEVPQQVASEAMRTIGTLSAGDGFAWRGVKQAKDMARPVLMARVGIHHRLIFRVDAGVMDVLDLITREQLLTTLKRLRAQR